MTKSETALRQRIATLESVCDQLSKQLGAAIEDYNAEKAKAEKLHTALDAYEAWENYNKGCACKKILVGLCAECERLFKAARRLRKEARK